MKENELSYLVRGAAFKVHSNLGPGLLESVYEAAMSEELKLMKLKAEFQVPIPIVYKSIKLECGFRLDILVEDMIILELKSVESLVKVHHKQLLSYLKLTDKKLGFLINFNSVSLDSKSMIRIVNKL